MVVGMCVTVRLRRRVVLFTNKSRLVTMVLSFGSDHVVVSAEYHFETLGTSVLLVACTAQGM
jgi:hypothetical protein